MAILTKAIYKFSAIPIKKTNGIFHRIGKNNSKICVKKQKPHIDKNILRKKNKDGGIMPSVFKPNYKATVIKTI